MFLVNILFQISYCTIVGIDLGSDSIKVAVGSRYKPVHLVRNLYSNEATPNIFTYRDNSHWAFGEGAIDQCLIHPETCIKNQRVPLDNKLYFAGNNIKGYQIVALSLLQIIQNVKDIEHIVDDIKVVIAIPPSMTNREKSYLYSALSIAGINCVQFVTSTYAPIEVYVNEKKYGFNSDNTAVFIDIGHEGVRVSGFEFDNSKIIQKFGQYNDNIGGKTIDNNLLKLIVNKYNLRLSMDNYEYNKNQILLLSKIKKAREQLTVNSKVSFDFKSITITLTRKDIDDCSFEIKKALNQMIQSLKETNKNLLKSRSVHLLGGCSRIPCLQEYINKILPNFRQLKTMDIISSVCMGACYIIDSEIPSNIQVHDALVSTEVILKVNGNIYKLFTYDNTENFNPVVRLNNINSHETFSIIDKNDNDQEFTRFTINCNNFYTNTIDVGFTLNYFLMPVPDQPFQIQMYGNKIPLSIKYEKIGWEVTPEELSMSKISLNSMLNGLSKRMTIEKHLNSIDEYKIFVENKLKNYGYFDWRQNSFTEICNYIDSRYKSCIQQNGYECPEEKIKSILDEFKSLVHSTLKIDDDDFERNFVKLTERQKAIDELKDLIEVCKFAGTRYSDVENWLNNSQQKSLKDIYERIGILKERGKNNQNSYFY